MSSKSAMPRKRRPYAARVPLEERREQILDAAITIIARDGYARISIDSIAKEAGVTRPVVYGAFDDLHALLTTLLDRQQQRALKQLEEVLPSAITMANPDELVAQTVRRLVQTVTSDPLTWRPVLFASQGSPKAVRDRVADDWERVRQQIAGLLDLGLALRGGPQLDTEVLSHALMAILEHFGRLLLDHPDTFDTERLVDTVQTLLASLKP